MSKFKLKKISKLMDMKLEDEIPESDFLQHSDGLIYQFKYVNDDTSNDKYDVKPGVWAVSSDMSGFKLIKTSFVKDEILKDLVTTKTYSEKIHRFFQKLDVYKKHGIEVPKRGMLFYGPPGTGKSVTVSESLNEFTNDNKTAIVVWATDKYEPYQVKDFIQTFKYVNGVERVILIAEDIGGVEIENVQMKSDASLLSLLDNNEKTFTLPILIIATTNHPEIFLGNLTNRPGRFDDKFEVGFPTKESRKALYKFYGKEACTEEASNLIATNKFDQFTPAHIREIVIRADIYDLTHAEAMNEMIKEVEHYKKAFQKKMSNFGLLSEQDDD